MAKIKLNEQRLKQIISENIKKVLKESGEGVLLTNDQINSRNAAINQSLDKWNSLGYAGQIIEIQKLVGAKPDGKLGPQTLLKIYQKLSGDKDLADIAATSKPGQKPTYTNIPTRSEPETKSGMYWTGK